LKQILEKKDKMFSKVKDSGAGKELKQLQKAILTQKKNFNSMATDSIFDHQNNEDDEELMSPMEPKREVAAKIINTGKRASNLMKSKANPAAHIGKRETKEKGTQVYCKINFS
jgi:hypothetical protein